MKYNVKSSGYLVATTQVVSGTAPMPGGQLHSVTLLPDATNACSVVVYNSSTNTSGKEVAVLSIAALGIAPQTIVFNSPVDCPNGIRAVLAGSGGTVIVNYSLGS